MYKSNSENPLILFEFDLLIVSDHGSQQQNLHPVMRMSKFSSELTIQPQVGDHILGMNGGRVIQRTLSVIETSPDMIVKLEPHVIHVNSDVETLDELSNEQIKEVIHQYWNFRKQDWSSDWDKFWREWEDRSY